MSKKLTTEEFLKRANEIHKGKYQYSKVVYNGCQKNVIITCPEHGDFPQTPLKHLQGQGCPECAKIVNKVKHMKNLDSYISRFSIIHNNKYSYDNSIYKSSKDKIIITCPIHGDFPQTIDDHLQGKGCPICGHISSKFEEEIAHLLNEFNITIERHNKTILNGKELDIFLPTKNIAIECNGLRWHSELFNKNKNYHLEKLEECLKQNITLIQIFEDEWIHKKDIVIKKLIHILHLNENKPKIMGRKCKIKEIDYSTAKTFLDKYHIQGGCSATFYLGCYFNDELIGVMTFNKNVDEWELSRFATNYEYICQGVGGKLFSYFIKYKKPSIIKSFADRRWTNNSSNLYTVLGFELVSTLPPDYRYYFPSEDKTIRFHKFNFRKERLNKKFGLPLTLTEREMADHLSAYKIWDCGLLKYVYKKKEEH